MGRRDRNALSRVSGEGGDRAAAVGRLALGLAILASFFLVDTGAEAGFDAPKRLAALLGIAVAASGLVLGSRPPIDVPWTAMRRGARAAAILLGLAVTGAALAALLSPRQELGLGALRVALLYACLLPIGATRLTDGAGGRALLAAFVAGATASGAMAAGQAAGLWTGVHVEAITGRSPAFALVGNEGVLGLALGLAAVAALAPLVLPSSRRTRIAAVASLPLLLLGLASTANLTGVVALLVGAAVLVGLAAPRRALVAAGAALLASVVLTALPPVRARLAELAGDLRAGRLDAAISGRLAPWAAALEMVRERPLTGFGPGTFAAEYAPHRVAAELRLRRRLVHPKVTSSYAEAHSEPLQAAAEIGVPAVAAAIAALVFLVWGARAPASRGGKDRAEVVVLLALLAAGAVAALLWFPLQRPVTALPLLLAAGRLWRLGGGAR